MADYKIIRLQGGELGIQVESDRAGRRSQPDNIKGMTLEAIRPMKYWIS